jgi:ribosome-binding protein aMBF1 (putative translation factor)
MPRFKSTKPIDRLVRSSEVARDYTEVGSHSPENTAPERFAKKWTEGKARQFRARFAAQLKTLREEAGLSLHALAQKADVDHSQLVRLESGERTCTLETAVKIAAALGVGLGILADEPQQNA